MSLPEDAGTAAREPFSTSVNRRRRIVWLLVTATLFVVLVLAWLPSLLISTSLGMRLLNQQLQPFGLQATAKSASGGWFAPLSVRSVIVGKPKDSPLLEIDELAQSHSLWNLVTQHQDLGRITLNAPRLHFITTANGSNFELNRPERSTPIEPEYPGREAKHKSQLTTQIAFAVQNAEVWLQTRTMSAEAILVRDVDVMGTLRQTPLATELELASGYLLDQVTISPEICDGGLKFIVPVLSEAAWVQGQVSVELTQCRVDLQVPEQTVISGAIDVHQVSAGIKNELVQRIADIVNQLLGRTGTGQIELVSSRIGFHVRDGRVWHEGLVFGLPKIAPDLQIQSHGSVGFDETLDLEFMIPMPRSIFRNEKIADLLSGQTLRLPVHGTLDKPEVEFDGDGLLAAAVAELGQSFADGDLKLQDLIEPLRRIRENRSRRPFQILRGNSDPEESSPEPIDEQDSESNTVPADDGQNESPQQSANNDDSPRRPLRRLLRGLRDASR